ncbi:alpha/beta fold hydrolase [Sorangium sp. So ce726]|uniref:alpha/beta hydrolase n=1 Tax=Sorangium sp. So ce726 TaxID=3133319 RepID=UPI003F62B16E
MVDYPIGYRSFHRDVALNYQLNRWLPVMEEAEVTKLAGEVSSAADFSRAMRALAERTGAEGRHLHASSYFRAAEFFLPFGDPEKGRCYEAYRAHFDRVAAALPLERRDVPFRGGVLPAVRFAAPGPARDTIVLHGGFDSYIEEFFFWGPDLAAQGFDVVMFEGPGQGAALRRHGLTMSPAWEEPVAAVLDHLSIQRASLIGLSLGGCLGIRAAAHEPRIERVVAWNILFDFYDCFAARLPPALARALAEKSDAGDDDAVNATLASLASAGPEAAWALAHGQHISGSRTPADFVRWLRAMNTRAASPRVRQDVLLLAGTADHIVPLHQLTQQMEALTGARSVTARIFTAADHAASHCQVGNLPLAHEVIARFLDLQLRPRDEQR